MTTVQPAQISLEKSQFLKGLAIIMVVVIHTLAYLPGIYTTSQFQIFYIAIDQLGRFCVPLFLLLSGYGLAVKYKDEVPAWVPFLKKRVLKLIPLYLIWSVVSHTLLSIIPAWESIGPSQPLWYQLLTGSSDYQLYFVVLIFQLYALFPFFLKLVKKFPLLTLFTSFAIQLGVFAYYYNNELPGQFNLDGFQYIFFVSWIGYFVLGIWLALKPLPVKLIKIFLPLMFIGATIVVWDSWYLIKNYTDPLLALKFTRWPVMLYAVVLILWMITRSELGVLKVPLSNWIQKVLNYLGKQSYLIFLAHTIGLRIIFSAERNLISIPLIVLLTCTWLTTILFSQKVSSQ
ncbi:MAG: acyltransferase [Patescibacteria group bacterium]